MDWLNNLTQNKLFLQYLAGAGADIGAGNPIGQNVNAITQQAIASQNFSKLLSEVLGKGGKAVIDKDNTKLDMPTSLLGNLSGGTDAMRKALVGQLTGIQSIEPIEDARQPNPFLQAL